MSLKNQNQGYKKFLFILAGGVALILGVTLVLAWWKEAVIFFKGAAGMTLAVAGLVILYFLQQEK